MSKIIKIGITQTKGSSIINVNSAEVIKGKGIVNDRKFIENNQKERQITLVEIENINYFNNISKTNIPPLNFRRNIVTKNVKLNDLIGKEFFVGNIKLKAHDLCRPCKYLQDSLTQENLIKEMMRKAGLRCEILTDGKIFVGNEINH